MSARYYVLLQAETGKCFVRPFSSLKGVQDSLFFHVPDVRKATLLPEPFRIYCDAVALYSGKPINFLASFYNGLSNSRVVYGDVCIVKETASGVDGLDETELRFITLSIQQCFGIEFPSFATA